MSELFWDCPVIILRKRRYFFYRYISLPRREALYVPVYAYPARMAGAARRAQGARRRYARGPRQRRPASPACQQAERREHDEHRDLKPRQERALGCGGAGAGRTAVTA